MRGNTCDLLRVPVESRSDLRPSFAQQGEDRIIEEILKRKLKLPPEYKSTYVDVGAYDPFIHSVTYLLYLRGWSGIVFDPSSATIFEFGRKRPNDIAVECLIGEVASKNTSYFLPKHKVGSRAFTGTRFPGEKLSELAQVFAEQKNLSDELIYRGVTDIDIMNLDIEGAELETLASFDFDRLSVKLILVEIHGATIEDCAQKPVWKLLQEKGYVAISSALVTHFFLRQDFLPQNTDN